MTIRAVILFSGGLDSTVMLAKALAAGRECLAITFDYKQRHYLEIGAAKQIADYYGIAHKIISIDPRTFARSSLISHDDVPKNRNSSEIMEGGIPSTYVPGRNTLFLAYAVGHAEVFDASEIHFGANGSDNLPYPDARPEYIQAYQVVINLATRQAVEGHPPQLITPFLSMHKEQIVKEGLRLNAPIHLTFSCYDPPGDNVHCGHCDACYLRKEGFAKASIPDPSEYKIPGLPLQAGVAL